MDDTTPSRDVATPDRVSLSRELSELLVQLSVALHRHSMYPTGHPSLGPAIDGVLRRANQLLSDRSSLAIGVARRQLIIDGVATDADNPVLRRLAESLHAHHFGAITLLRGLRADELAEALLVLATEPVPDADGGPGGDGSVTSWTHLRLHPLTFDGLALVGDAPLTSEGSDRTGDTRGAELWVGLARAALCSDGMESVPTEPAVVARAIDEHPSADAYDQVVVGYLLQIARELKSATGAESEALRKKTSSLIASLQPDTLRRLVQMGGDVGQRSEFVLDAAHGMAVRAVLEIVKAAADANGQTISHGLVRMLSKLAAHTEMGTEKTRTRADGELREQVVNLLADWQLADPNPEAYGRVLQHLATSTRQTGRSGAGAPAPADMSPLRVVQMSLETGVFGCLAATALGRLVDQSGVSAVVELLGSRPDGSEDASRAMLAALVQPDTLSSLVRQEPIDVDSLGVLVPHMSAAGIDLLFDALASSEVRITRRRLVDLLSRKDLDVEGAIVTRLQDERWYVQRNMLGLLERRGRVPEGFSLTPWTTHADPRVRLAAVRLLFTLPGQREHAILAALQDVDARIVTLGLRAIEERCPPAVVALVADLALASEGDDDLLCLAATVLGRVRRSEALNALLTLSDGGRSLLGRQKLPPRTPALVAAVRGLAQQWTADPQAASVLAAAARSSDPELRQAARTLSP